MATVHRNWIRDDAPPEVRAERTRSAETVTAFINAGPNWWLDERQAWLDAVIARETANGGSAFKR